MNQTTRAKLKVAMNDAIDRSLSQKMTIRFMATQAGVTEAVVRTYLTRQRHPSPSNPAKRARALAFREAKRRGLWKQGESQVYSKWWRRLLRRLFPKYAARWSAVIGRWYKAQVKRWAKAARAYVHDREAQAFERTRQKLERQRQREYQRKMFGTKEAPMKT